MKPGIENHPAIRMGEFLKNQRIGAGLTLREASVKIGVPASKLAELERGIGDHLNDVVYDGILDYYGIDNELYILEALNEEVVKSPILAISDIYYEEELLPAFIPLTEKQRERILKTLGFRK